jgi:rod shape-determining protein MreC
MLGSILSNLKTFALLAFISILLIFADNLTLLNLPKRALQFVAVPIQLGLYKSSQGVAKQFEFITTARRAAQEHKAQQEQLAQILSENANLRRKLAETQGFLDQQRSLDPKTYSQVTARPISFSRYLKIDKGSVDGLKVNMPVVYKDNYLGQIKEVSPATSLVILSSDPDSKIAAFSQGDAGKARGVLAGQFGSEMLLDKILHQEPIKAGDLVYSEGTEGTLPRGLVLGQVSQVLDRPNEIFKQAKVKEVFNVNDLDIVFVVTN